MRRVRITQSFLLFFALFAGVELISRLFFTRTLSGRFEYGYHPTAGFVEKADGTVDLVRAGGRRFFPQTFRLEKPEGTLRLMVIGDSVARGRNVPSSYAGQLGGMLRADGVKAESFNLGVPGYGARRKEITAARALTYGTDVLVLHVNGSNEYEDEREWKRYVEFQSWHPRNWLMKSVVVRRLYEVKTEKMFWFWLPPEIRMQTAVSDADAEVAAGINEAKLTEWRALLEKHTRSTVETALKAGVKVVLVTQATFDQTAPPGGGLDGGGLDAMTEGLLGPEVMRVSMFELFKGRTDLADLYADGAHIREKGHEILARAIADLLEKEGWARPGGEGRN